MKRKRIASFKLLTNSKYREKIFSPIITLAEPSQGLWYSTTQMDMMKRFEQSMTAKLMPQWFADL